MTNFGTEILEVVSFIFKFGYTTPNYQSINDKTVQLLVGCLKCNHTCYRESIPHVKTNFHRMSHKVKILFFPRFKSNLQSVSQIFLTFSECKHRQFLY